MKAGMLDKLITIQSVTIAPDTFGQAIETWADVADVAARVMPVRGGESFTESQRIGRAVTTFQIRYRTAVTAGNRIVYGGRNWDILDVREVGRREGLEIDARARAE